MMMAQVSYDEKSRVFWLVLSDEQMSKGWFFFASKWRANEQLVGGWAPTSFINAKLLGGENGSYIVTSDRKLGEL